MGDGRWLNLGGNQAVDPGGVTSNSQDGNNTYQDSDGGFAARTITPGTNAQWSDDHTLDLYVFSHPFTSATLTMLSGQ